MCKCCGNCGFHSLVHGHLRSENAVRTAIVNRHFQQFKVNHWALYVPIVCQIYVCKQQCTVLVFMMAEAPGLVSLRTRLSKKKKKKERNNLGTGNECVKYQWFTQGILHYPTSQEHAEHRTIIFVQISIENVI